MTNEAVTGADQLLASIKEKDARIKEIEALGSTSSTIARPGRSTWYI